MGFGEFGIEKLLLLFIVVLLLFGAKRIPEIAGSVGMGIREFKRSVSELRSGTMDEEVRSGSEAPRPAERSAEPPREVKRLM